MKILNILLIIIVLVKIVHSYECGPNRTFAKSGDSCKVHGDCNFPDVCYEGKCGRIRMPGQSCKVKSDCTLNFNWAECIEGECVLNIKVGEKCGERIHSFKGNCVKGSQCIKGTCQLTSPCNQFNCPLNTFCNLDTKKCQPFNGTNSSCKNDDQCESDQHCNSNGKCVDNYSSKVGDSCTDNSERSCNYYNGEICNTNTKKCEINPSYFKSCNDESDCNGGLCVCTGSSKTVCVGPSGEIKEPKCKDYEAMLQRCIEKEGCSNLTPISCSKCFVISECIQYTCNAVEKFYDYKSNYYRTLDCPSELSNSKY
ncbi:hypothetical protein DICPUDRAFT_93141 [Dictyostelium purpureum]|uniref:Dickkopf N-terminal cysteine-rich domain-containing protein n=1 Tax=Dictyostelium purpureum TaxID=5786 RepID=F1A2T5_DICPU|nr:uncharacterized protein DICPUDRAFT_93141 [Dictyostelium purpureum]EGC29489.1 hypothetical protein DICPUDRAFT_93141 [Dictyostelium purpureum]|eukprot:XP_003293979.1 hypothetical protein DICPUDRAFT_93141 [Dictyostelium purpureum]